MKNNTIAHAPTILHLRDVFPSIPLTPVLLILPPYSIYIYVYIYFFIYVYNAPDSH